MTLTIAVTGLNATDNPGPGVPVIRSIREAAGQDCRIVGLAYEALDPGNYMSGIADEVYMMPYPSQGAEATLQRLLQVHAEVPIDVILPTLDAELPIYIKLSDELDALGIRSYLPTSEQLEMRSKANLQKLRDEYDVSVPRSALITSSAQLYTLDLEMRFPIMVKGQFYDAFFAHSPMEAERYFQQIRSKWGLPVVVQEFVTGEEFDVVAVGTGTGDVVGSVAMRKMQLTDKGKAWGGITIADEKLESFVADVISKLKWRGPLELEVMKEADTGKYYLIEINPRFPAWVYLTVGAERNLPWATVQLALGQDIELMPPAKPGLMFLRHSLDLICPIEQFEALTTKGQLTHNWKNQNA